MAEYLIPSSTPHVRQFFLTSAHDPDRVGIRTEWDAQYSLDYAAELRHAIERAGTPLRHRLGRVVAVMPIYVWCIAQKEKWDQKKIRAWLEDPANAGLRVERPTRTRVRK